MAEKRPERCSLDFHGVLGNESILGLQELFKRRNDREFLYMLEHSRYMESPILSPERYYNLLRQSRHNIIKDVRHLKIIAPLGGVIPGVQLLARVCPEPLHLITGMPESAREALGETLEKWALDKEIPDLNRHFRKNRRASLIGTKVEHAQKEQITHSIEDDEEVIAGYVEAGAKVFAIINDPADMYIPNSPLVMRFHSVLDVAIAVAMAGSLDGVFEQHREELQDPKLSHKIFRPELPCKDMNRLKGNRLVCVVTARTTYYQRGEDGLFKVGPKSSYKTITL